MGSTRVGGVEVGGGASACPLVLLFLPVEKSVPIVIYIWSVGVNIRQDPRGGVVAVPVSPTEAGNRGDDQFPSPLLDVPHK